MHMMSLHAMLCCLGTCRCRAYVPCCVSKAYLGSVENCWPKAGLQAELMALAALGGSIAVQLGEQVAGVYSR